MRNVTGQITTSSPRFLDLGTAATRAGFSVRHFRRIIEDESIPTLRLGRKCFILASDFEAWKEAQEDQRPA
jgi:excisionase family DNA binding protein